MLKLYFKGRKKAKHICCDKNQIIFQYFRSLFFRKDISVFLHSMCEQFMSSVFAVHHQNTFSFTHFSKQINEWNTSCYLMKVFPMLMLFNPKQKKSLLIKKNVYLRMCKHDFLEKKKIREWCAYDQTCVYSTRKYQEHCTWLIYKWHLESIKILLFWSNV